MNTTTDDHTDNQTEQETTNMSLMQRIKNHKKKIGLGLLGLLILIAGTFAYQKGYGPFAKSDDKPEVADAKDEGTAPATSASKTESEDKADDPNPETAADEAAGKDETEGDTPEAGEADPEGLKTKVAELAPLEEEVKLKLADFDATGLSPEEVAKRVIMVIPQGLNEQAEDGTFTNADQPNRFGYTYNWGEAQALGLDPGILNGKRVPKIALRLHETLTPTNGQDIEILDFTASFSADGNATLILDYSAAEGKDIEGECRGLARVHTPTTD